MTNTHPSWAPAPGSSVTFVDYEGGLRAGTVVEYADETLAVVLDLASGDRYRLDVLEDEYAVVAGA